MTTLNNQIVQDIFESLSLNVKLSQDLLVLLGNETEALKAMDTQELLKISKRKNTLLSKIQFLDKSLQNHVTDGEPASSIENKQTASVTPKTFKFSGLLELLPQDKQERAKQCKKKLKAIRQDILVKNYINKKFTEQTLSCLGEAIALFTQPASKRNTYNPSGIPPQRSSSLPQILSTEA